jgi:hypothetical protein
MPPTTDDAASFDIVVDAEQLRTAVTALRNAHVPPSERRPLNFDVPEHRSGSRAPLSLPIGINLLLIDVDGPRSAGPRTPGQAIDLSLTGLAFEHTEALRVPGHYAVTFALPTSEPCSLALQLLWSVKQDHGGFRTGGEFIGMLEPPLPA